jgi:GntR family transcriptional regulator
VDDPRTYIKIADQVRHGIHDGALAPGQPVPSITYLARQWGTDRHTAGRALQLLAGEGLLRRYPGSAGYRVTRRPDTREPAPSHTENRDD